jgi:hypothetical protein
VGLAPPIKGLLVWVGFFRTLSTPLTTFTNSMGSWHLRQESIVLCHSFDTLPHIVYFLSCLLLGCPAVVSFKLLASTRIVCNIVYVQVRCQIHRKLRCKN